MNYLIICSNDFINVQFESRSFDFNDNKSSFFFKGKYNEVHQYLTLKL